MRIDSPESSYLYTALSQISGSGQGLFTAINLYKDEVIALYKGELISDVQASARVKKGHDKYFIHMPDGGMMDSMKSKCFAMYANDAAGPGRSLFRNNGRIALNEEEQVCIIASRHIRSGEEIFCGYGRRYWKKHG